MKRIAKILLAIAVLASTVTAITSDSITPLAANINCQYGDYQGHCLNKDGFVTDGSPQPNDGKCVGDEIERSHCLVARRPECPGHEMDQSQIIQCWAPIANIYSWDQQEVMYIIWRESRGKHNASNGRYNGLMGVDHGDIDPAYNINQAYYDFYKDRGFEPWTCCE